MAKNAFIDKEISKIISDSPIQIALAGAWIYAHFKGSEIKVLHVGKTSSLAEYFVLGSASNTPQMSAICDSLSQQLKKNKINILSTEGNSNSDWALVDAGDVIFHIFKEEARAHFDLDDLWKSAPKVKIPEEFYVEGPKSEDFDGKSYV